MTTIRLHGILAQKYGKVFKMDISKPRDVIRAIDANRDGFRKTIIDLQKEGFSYEILVNKKRLNKESFLNSKKAQEIDLVPFIVGSGPMFFVALALNLVMAVIQFALMDPGTIDGGQSTVSASSKSMMFSSSKINLAAQGSPLPIGYGRLLVGSSVIQSSMKSLPQTADAIDGMVADTFVSEGNNFTAVEIADSKPLS
jgi:predicted phage tail protein